MKSNEGLRPSDHLELVQAVYADACAKCSAEISDVRDLETIEARVNEEGFSFLTITLPNFCRDFERSLAKGYVDSSCFRGFAKHGAIPAFLQGMLSHVFDQETGRKLDDSFDTPILVEAVRQICLLFKKIEIPCTPERARAAVDSYVTVEQINCDFTAPEQFVSLFKRTAAVLWGNMLGDLRPDMLVPRHGPGATAERILGNQKYGWQCWHERLENFFPFLGFGLPMAAAFEKEFEMVRFVPEDQEIPVRVILVPKTQKSPRIIAAEPVCMQYAQQAVQSELYARIGKHPMTAGHLNFVDQSVNKELALKSSRSGRYVTIDLKDASDRVTADLVYLMLDCVPDFRDLVFACRSTHASLPDGTIIGPLKKFASMGSALCFPIEAMLFYTACVAARLDHYNLPVTFQNVFNMSREVYVYGDDIIVPTAEADIVLDYLQKSNCKVNDDKTFLTGKFRESCGTDAYDGYEVTPTYVRRTRPQDKRQVQNLISWVATANQFYLKGYWKAASLMFSTCERILGPLPYVSPESSALGRVSFLGYRSAARWNDSVHSLEVKGWTPKPVYRCDSVDGYSALTKSLLSLKRREPKSGQRYSGISLFGLEVLLYPQDSDERHLERTVQRGAVTLKLRWVPAT